MLCSKGSGGEGALKDADGDVGGGNRAAVRCVGQVQRAGDALREWAAGAFGGTAR